MTARTHQVIVVGNGLIGSAAARHLAQSDQTVAVIGPGEPADPVAHDGVFSSHYDEGRLCSRVSRDPVWSPINRRAVDEFAALEAASGVPFHHGVGWLRAVRLDDDERRDLRRWIAETEEVDGVTIEHFEPGDRRWQGDIPMLDFSSDHDVIVEPNPAGYINPRRLLAAQNTVASAHGADIIGQLVVGVRSGRAGVTVTTDDGREHSADRALIACGAFTNFNELLPQPVPLRLKTETTIWASVSSAEAGRLRAMPGVGYDIDDPEIDDIYMAPPIRYPDGVHRIKMGCNTAAETWPTTLEQIQEWFRTGPSDRQRPAMERALRKLLPGLEVSAISSHRCIVTYTPSGYPTVDAAPGDPHGRLFVATGGNGSGAQGSNALGRLAAGLITDGGWPADVPRQAFSASNHWGEATKELSKAQQRAGTRPEHGPAQQNRRREPNGERSEGAGGSGPPVDRPK